MRRSILGAVALCVGGAAALAHNGATGIVMERMKGMTDMRNAMRSLAPMMQGAAPYDEAEVRKQAGVLLKHSGDTMTKLFPEEPIPKASYAQPAIWTDWDSFAELSDELKVYAIGLQEASVNGLMPAMTMEAALADPEMAAMPPEAPTRLSVGELMGVRKKSPPPAAPTLTSQPQPEPVNDIVDFAVLAADDVFESISGTCAACHALYRRAN